jgi:hypothetical protein
MKPEPKESWKQIFEICIKDMWRDIKDMEYIPKEFHVGSYQTNRTYR